VEVFRSEYKCECVLEHFSAPFHTFWKVGVNVRWSDATAFTAQFAADIPPIQTSNLYLSL
jgi:hypothetical protein